MKYFYWFVVLLLTSHPVFSEDEWKQDIDDMDFDVEFNEPVDNENAPWRLSFAWQNGIDLNAWDNTVSHRMDTRLEWEQLFFDDLFFKVDGKAIVRLPGDDVQSNQTKTELDGRLRELYLQRSGNFWTLTAGFQTLTLGEMDAVQVSDVFSPWDYSESAFTAPEDARLGQFLLNAQGYFGGSRWQLVYSPWPLTNRYPGGDADTLFQRLLGTPDITVQNKQPERLKDFEVLLKWQKNIGGSDIHLVYADLLSNDPVFQLVSEKNAPITRFQTDYFRFKLFAASANYSAGNFLWKLETAYKQNVKYQSTVIQKSDSVDVAVGADYDANGAWNLSVEILNQHLFSVDARLNKNNTQLVARWSKNWLYETLSSVIFISYQWQYGDTITSLALDYVVDDHWKLSLVGRVFQSTDSTSPGQFTKDWDQLVFRMNFTY